MVLFPAVHCLFSAGPVAGDMGQARPGRAQSPERPVYGTGTRAGPGLSR